MKAIVTIEIEVPEQISGKIVNQRDIVDAVKESLEVGIEDAQGLVEDFGNRYIFLNSQLKVLSVKADTLIK